MGIGVTLPHSAPSLPNAVLESMRVRPIANHDCDDLWHWRNDAQTRAMSLNSDKVPYADHYDWFTSVLNDATQRLYIGVVTTPALENQNVGMVRFDSPFDHLHLASTVKSSQRTNKGLRAAVVSINLNPAYRGQGLSEPLLRKALGAFLGENGEHSDVSLSLTHIRAWIKPANIASVKIFKAVGFTHVLSTNNHGQTNTHALEFLLKIAK